MARHALSRRASAQLLIRLLAIVGLLLGLTTAVGAASAVAAECGAPPTANTLGLLPLDQQHDAGQTATFHALYADGCGNPIAGATVTFFKLSGPSTTAQLQGTTDETGSAQVSYSNNNLGQDTWSAAVANGGFGNVFANNVTVEWGVPHIMFGRAYGLASTGLIKLGPTPDTGNVAATYIHDFGKCLVNLVQVPLLLTARAPCAHVITSTAPNGTVSSADVANVTLLGNPLVPAITLRTVSAGSVSKCGGSLGDVTIGYLKVGTKVLIPAAVHPAPNTGLTLGPVKIILNQQTPIPGGLTVNAVHIVISGVEDLVVASATSGIQGC